MSRLPNPNTHTLRPEPTSPSARIPLQTPVDLVWMDAETGETLKIQMDAGPEFVADLMAEGFRAAEVAGASAFGPEADPAAPGGASDRGQADRGPSNRGPAGGETPAAA